MAENPKGSTLIRLAHSFNYRQDFSLRLGLTVGGIIIGSVIILTIAASAGMRFIFSEDRGQDFRELAYYMADELDRGMFERYREIIQLSERATLRSERITPESSRPLLESLQNTYPYYAWIGFATLDGVIVAATEGVLEGANVSSRPWFIHGQTAPFVGDVHDAVLLAPYLGSGDDGSSSRLVDLSAPVYDFQGNLHGVIAAHLSWDWAEDIRESMLEPLRDRLQIDMTIIGANGTILLSHFPETFGTLWNDPSIPFELDNGYIIEEADSTPTLVGYARTHGYGSYPGMGWTVIVSQPTTLAFETANLIGLVIFLTSAVFAVMVALASWRTARRLLRPVVLLAAAADQIRPEDVDAKLPDIDGNDEIASLAHSLRRLFNAQKAYQCEIQRYNAELEQRVDERTAELRQRSSEIELLLETTRDALDRERTLNELKTRFTSLVSHEFRTPLSVILSSASMLQLYEQRMTVEKRHEHLTRIEAHVKSLDQLLDEVLSLSRSEALEQQSPRTPTDIVALINDTLTEFQDTTERHTLSLSVIGEPRMIAVHAKLLRQAIANLITNAIKYSPRGGAVSLCVQFGKIIEFSIQDEGIGITPDDITRLYEPFFRGQNVGEIKGTGLGMVIVKQAVDAHQGTIHLHSQINIGTKFTILIPSD